MKQVFKKSKSRPTKNKKRVRLYNQKRKTKKEKINISYRNRSNPQLVNPNITHENHSKEPPQDLQNNQPLPENQKEVGLNENLENRNKASPHVSLRRESDLKNYISNYIDSPQPYFILPILSDIPRVTHNSCFVYDNFKVQPNVLGEGSYGKVSSVCEKTNCELVAKIIQFNFNSYPTQYVFNLFYAESLITKFAGEKGFGIPLKDFSLCKEGNDIKGIVIMEKYKNTLDSIQTELTFDLMKQLFDKVTIMHNVGILHRDLFLRNVMYKETPTGKDIRIIDFGLSIPFGQEIHKPFRAIDYLNLINDIENPSLQKECLSYVKQLIDPSSLEQGQDWLNKHFSTCVSEYNLLGHIPPEIIINYGPATVDLLVWSVRCKPELDQDVIRKTNEKIKQWSRE